MLQIQKFYPAPGISQVGIRKSLVGVGLFALLFLMMSTVGGAFAATHASGLNLSANAEEARAAFGGSDAGSYLQAALGLRDLGPQGVGGNQWVYNLWPPGMVTVNLLLVTAEQLVRLPYVFLLVTFSALAWTLILSRIFWFFEEKRSGYGWLFVGFFLMSSLGADLLSVYIGYADALAAGFLVLSVLELSKQSPTDARAFTFMCVRASLFLSLAMHFRTTYETVTSFVLVVAVVSVLALALVSKLPGFSYTFTWKSAAPTVGFVSVGAQLLSVPWRLIAGTFVRPGDFRWTTTLDQAPGMRWVPTSMYSPEAGFLRSGHANFGCLNDPVRCEQIAAIESLSAKPYSGFGAFSQADFQSELVQSFLSLPLVYGFERVSMLVSGFFSATGGAVGDWRIFEGVFLLLGVILGFLATLKRREALSGGPWMAFLAIGSLAGVLLFFHMETRYMFPIKMLSLFIISLALTYRPTAKPPGASARGPLDRGMPGD